MVSRFSTFVSNLNFLDTQGEIRRKFDTDHTHLSGSHSITVGIIETVTKGFSKSIFFFTPYTSLKNQINRHITKEYNCPKECKKNEVRTDI